MPEVELRIVSRGESTSLKVDSSLKEASDEEIFSYVSEVANIELDSNEYCIDKTEEAILVRPRAVYG